MIRTIRTLLLFLFCGASTCTLAQPTKQFEVIGDRLTTNNIVFLSEIHGIYEGIPFKLELTRFFAQNYGITNIALEGGKAEAYLFNAYFSGGDTTVFIQYPERETRDYLAKWKQIYEEHPFKILGIDFERLEFVIAVRSILDKNPGAQNTGLYKYLLSIADTAMKIDEGVAGHKERIKIYNQACDLFRQHKDSLKALMHTGFETVEEIFENPATEKGMRKRDKTMLQNLIALHPSENNKILCIIGASHASPRARSTLLNRYLKHYDTAHKISVVEMVCKSCYNTSYYGEMFFPINVGASFKGRKVDILSAAYDQYYKPGYYTIIPQERFKDLAPHYNSFPTYYVLFKDQPGKQAGK